MGFFKSLTGFLLIILWVFAIFQALKIVDAPNLLEQTKTEPLSTVGASACYGLAFTSTTPAFRFDWLPPEGKYYYMLEDLPLFDSTDLFILIPLFFLTYFGLKASIFKNQWNPILQWLAAIGIILLIMIIAWILIKVIAYQLMFTCGSHIDLTREQIIQTRDETINIFLAMKALEESLILTIFSSLGVLRIFFGSKDK